MKRLLRGERIMALCAAAFLVVCVGHYSMKSHPGEGMVVAVSRAGQGASVEEQPDQDVPKTLLPGEKIDLNTASAKDLARLPGIGTDRAEQIVAWRETHGRFRTILELKTLDGIGAGLYSRLEPYITVGDVG